MAQLNSHPSRMVRPACAASRGIHFRFVVHAKGGVRLYARKRGGNISPAQMAHSMPDMIETIECPVICWSLA